MAIITPPSTPEFRVSRFGLRTNTQRFVSPLDGSVQTRELPGAKWAATLTLPPLVGQAQAAPWRSFLVQLRGSANRFLVGDPDHTSPRGIGTGTPLVNGGSQTGNSLVTDGWTTGQTGIMLEGDYIQFTNGDGNEELHMVVADVNSDGGGNATLTIEPSIRSSPANNAAITVTSASCEMALLDDEQAFWDAEHLDLYGISFAAEEVFT